jgi:hypothetical protein
MQRYLDNLESSIITDLNIGICWQRQVGQAKLARERVLGRARDLEDGMDDVGHVWRLGAIAHVDVEKRGRMACVPARDYNEPSAVDRPFCSVGCYAFTTA